MTSCPTSARSVIHMMKLMIQLSTRSGKRNMHLCAILISIYYLEAWNVKVQLPFLKEALNIED